MCQSPERQGRWNTPGAVPSWNAWEGTTLCLPNTELLLLALAAAHSPALHQHGTICLQSGMSCAGTTGIKQQL